MTSSRVFNQAGGALALTLFSLVGCNAIVGLDKLEVTDHPAGSAGSSSNGGQLNESGGSAGKEVMQNGAGSGAHEEGGEGGMGGAPDPGDCKTNQECTDRFTDEAMDAMGEAGAAGVVAGACIKTPIPHCVKLLTEDCDAITGDYTNDQAIFVGSLLSTKGATAATNLARQKAAALGIEQINTTGGVPAGSTSANPRPLVMVSCDESTNLVRAAGHLVNDLHVPAIVGPNTSQDTLDVSTKVSVPGGTVVMSPTGVASSIAALSDNDLTWLMVPSDVQRAPLMISQINSLETQLKADRAVKQIKLGVIFRNDALGIGTRTALNDLTINGKSLAGNENVQISPYTDAPDTNQQALVDKYLSFLPDIIVLAGTAESIKKVMEPLEKDWPNTLRPYYVLIDSNKVKDLTDLAINNEHELARRVRGTGLKPGADGSDSAKTYETFRQDYGVRYPGEDPNAFSGTGPAHDAAYAIGLALAATRSEPVSGASVAAGLRKLAGGATKLTTTLPNVLPAFQKLGAGEKITAIGTFGALDWDADGAVLGGTLEMWCIGGTPAKPAYASSGLLFDLKSQTMSGSYVPCTP
jgi:ABC-type branched-subunit amino acid transport system substrate-binding protein